MLSKIKITTDRGVDTSSIDTIVRDVVRGASTDEARVLALFHWYRRIVFHHRCADADRHRRNLLKVIHSLGYNLCGSQAALMVMLLQKAGYRTRVVVGNAPGDFGGHTFFEVHFDDRWHCFDTMTSFFVYTRDKPPHIASLAELRADPTLITKAIAERRAPPAFVYCTRHQERSGADKAGLAVTMGERDLTWSTMLFTSGSLVDFWSKAPASTRVLDESGTYGGRYTEGMADIGLRAGETLVRPWDWQGPWIKGSSHPDFGPHHTCGAADEHDPVNFKFFEPYRKDGFGHARRSYRRYGNGWQEWRPANTAAIAALGVLDNLSYSDRRTRLKVADPDRPASFLLPWHTPYATLQFEVELDLRQDNACTTTVWLKNGETPEGTFEVLGKHSGSWNGPKIFVLTPDSGPFYTGELKITTEGGPVRFRLARLRTVFQLNPAALPTLYPGENVIQVSAAETRPPRGARLRVTYEWFEGPGWRKRREDTRFITKFPHTYRVHVDVRSDKMPRMNKIELALEPASGPRATPPRSRKNTINPRKCKI